MTRGRRNSGPKSAKNHPSLLSFPATGPFSSFSLRCGLQPPPPSSLVFPPSAPPQESINRPPRATVNLSLSSLQPLPFSSSSFASSATSRQLFHRSSQRHRPDHQLNLLITAVTTAFSSARLQLLQPFGCMQNVNSNCL